MLLYALGRACQCTLKQWRIDKLCAVFETPLQSIWLELFLLHHYWVPSLIHECCIIFSFVCLLFEHLLPIFVIITCSFLCIPKTVFHVFSWIAMCSSHGLNVWGVRSDIMPSLPTLSPLACWKALWCTTCSEGFEGWTQTFVCQGKDRLRSHHRKYSFVCFTSSYFKQNAL